MDIVGVVIAVASVVSALVAAIALWWQRHAAHARLHVELLRDEVKKRFNLVVTNVSSRDVWVIGYGLRFNGRHLPPARVPHGALPRKMQLGEQCSFSLRLDDFRGDHGDTGLKVARGWVRDAHGTYFDSNPRRPSQPPAGKKPWLTAAFLSWLSRPQVPARAITTAYAFSLGTVLWLGKPIDCDSRPRECVTVVVASSQEKSDLLAYLAERYNRTSPTVEGRRVRIVVELHRSGDAERSLAEDWDLETRAPDVWTPAASTWVALLQADREKRGKSNIIPTGTLPSIAQSPLVIAMPREMAEVLGWPEQRTTWREIFTMAMKVNAWTDKDHAEWDPFVLRKTDPLISTSGLHTLIAQYSLATGRWNPSCTEVASADVKEFVRKLDSQVKLSESVRTILQRWYDSAEPLRFASAAPVEEAQLINYNLGNPRSEWSPPGTREHRPLPRTPLRAIYPTDGTLIADHPYVILQAEGVAPQHREWATAEKRKAAREFLVYLQAQQKFFLEFGFRDDRGATIYDGRQGVTQGGPPAPLRPPQPEVIKCIIDSRP